METASNMIKARETDWLRGAAIGSSIAIGYIPAALTFGLLAKGTGLTLLETIAMSLFVYAGASQYMALTLIAIGTGTIEIILTTFIVNIRHLLMSASIRAKMEDTHPVKRAITAFGITDEVFALVTSQDRRLTNGFVIGVAVIAYVSWVVHSAVGYIVGSALPATLQQGMGVALYAMFIALLIPSVRKHRSVLILAGTAALLNGLFSLFFPSGWSIILATLIASVGYEIGKAKKGARA
ncbi:AzlC family ABC transporter permease [Halalkalibacterium halodurans]|uniref:Branched-chain amino acid ABC transporter permease n=1 Tax=Halalkalibacterium halodurans TaxID=86665 RepID=A0A0M0KIS1_ALKHA|nr:AzlC family ABC transporter permease [Halalkalibacterium halodurans]MDY7223462.1 AzlC family ABC transporter permease [Halalkalibacterium halodurans]MDY7242683.1 AzlC family ABC transporter permease [Halalkalibacterium halodurans]MED3645343.1 AzlC family ABC transporter permease [Halalkalibacterium halodurans]MED4081610.1 AzlC family ABC transporter permease [Halalkalibacterium halodurans]MED4084978.1 AzlC family ABC transporter permease [Halalkalibacterium halodurans]